MQKKQITKPAPKAKPTKTASKPAKPETKLGELQSTRERKTVLMQGNEAVAYGALDAGCNFFAGLDLGIDHHQRLASGSFLAPVRVHHNYAFAYTRLGCREPHPVTLVHGVGEVFGELQQLVIDGFNFRCPQA